jgi:TP901 family phage tail tape measure protein
MPDDAMHASGGSGFIPRGSGFNAGGANLQVSAQLLEQMVAALGKGALNAREVNRELGKTVRNAADAARLAVKIVEALSALKAGHAMPSFVSGAVADMQALEKGLDIVHGKKKRMTDEERRAQMELDHQQRLRHRREAADLDVELSKLKKIAAEKGKIAAQEERRRRAADPDAIRAEIVARAEAQKMRHAEIERLRRERPDLVGHMTGGPKGGWLGGTMQQIKYWGRLKLMMDAWRKLGQSVTAYVDMEETINRAVRTAVKDTTNYNEVMLAREQILRASMQYLSGHIGTIGEYTEAVYKLTEAEMSRAEALKTAPTVMALAKGLDAPIETTTKLLVGLNELYKDAMPQFATDSERINKISSMLAVASKKEMASVEQMTTGLSYFGAIARQVGMPIEQMIALTARLNTNLLQGSKAGTGLRQVLNSLSKNAAELNQEFGLGIDMSKPVDVLDVLRRLQGQLSGGALSAGRLQQVLGGFELRGASAAILSAKDLDRVIQLANELKLADLENVFSMRDIMETNVPAQFEILAKNIDYVGAAFLRGAVGGNDMARSIQNINRAMPEVQIVAKSLGDTVGVLTNKYTLIGAAIGGAIVMLRRLQLAMIATNASAMATNALGIAFIAAGAATYFGNRYNEGILRAHERAGENVAKGRADMANLNELRDILSDTAVTSETLAKAKELLARRSTELGEAFDQETSSAKQLLAVIQRLSEKQQTINADAAKQYDYTTSRKLENMRGTTLGNFGQRMAAFSFFGLPILLDPQVALKTANVGAYNLLENRSGVMETLDSYAQTLAAGGMGEGKIRGKLIARAKPLLATLNDAITGNNPAFSWQQKEAKEYLEQLKLLRKQIEDRIADPLQKGVTSLDAIRRTVESGVLLAPLAALARNYFIGRDVTGADGKKISIRGKRFADSFYYSVERQRNRRAFGDAFDKEYNLSSVVQEIIKSAGNPRDAQKMLQAFIMGGSRALDTFPQIADAIRKVNPRLLDTYGPYMRGGVYGMANEFSLRRDGRRLSPESVNALIQDMAGNETELSSNTDALKQLTAAIQDLDQKIAPPGTGLTPEMLQPSRRNVAALMPYDIPPMLARPGMVGGGAAATVVINLNDGQLAAFVARAGEALAHTIPIADEAAAKSSALIAAARAAKARGAAIANT